MDFIIVIGIGAILVATGVITPKPNDDEVAEAEDIKTEEVITPPPEIKSNRSHNQNRHQNQNQNLHQNQNQSQNQLKNQNQKKKLIRNNLRTQDAKPEEPELRASKRGN